MLAIWRNLWTDGVDLGGHAGDLVHNHLKSVASIELR